MQININKTIEILEKSINDPTKGLPEEIFLFICRNIPVVGVDLLIKDENNRTLLSWRNDKFNGVGWHIPGGILRLKETLIDRVKKVAEVEIHTKKIKIEPNSYGTFQYINDQKERCHVVSHLFKCHLPSTFIPENKNLSIEDAGFLMWHDKCPYNLLGCQEFYRKYINGELEC